MTKHGIAYKAKTKSCLCVDCKAALTREYSVRAYRRAMGINVRTFVDAHETRRKIRLMYRKGGLSLSFVASEVGLNKNHIIQMRSRSEFPKTVQTTTAKNVDALYARYSAQKINRKVVSMRVGYSLSRLVVLGLQGLQAQGWSQQWIAGELGVSRQRVHQLSSGRDKYVTPEVEAKVLALVKRVGSTESDLKSATFTKNRAAKNGFVPTMMWDELV